MDGKHGGRKLANWEDRIEVKKGSYGERLVRNYLESRGWIVYEPVTGKAHAFDKLCVKDKKNIVISEVKTKAKMNLWNATGFNVKHYNEYRLIQDKYGIQIFIFFVDEMLKKIYGNKLSVLEKEYVAKDGKYPKTLKIKRDSKEIILFSLEIMKFIADIEDKDSIELKNNSSRNYDYI